MDYGAHACLRRLDSKVMFDLLFSPPYVPISSFFFLAVKQTFELQCRTSLGVDKEGNYRHNVASMGKMEEYISRVGWTLDPGPLVVNLISQVRIFKRCLCLNQLGRKH